MQHVAKKLGRWGLALLPLLGCGSGDHAPPPAALDDDTNPPSQLHQTEVDPCAAPNTDCPCEDEGTVLDCGTVSEHRGDYVICYPGTRACTDGVWGECTADMSLGGTQVPAGD